MAELRPYPLGALVTRMFRELDRNRSVFDLPERRFFAGDPDRDFSVSFHGHRCGSPLGPAAGPQTQMAQNIVLSWLAGSRVLELKTVQVRDDLAIPRPCIDMRTVGYNAEWSQELRVEESLDEYVKGMMLVEMLRASGRFGENRAFAPVVYDMSLGYDLAGIRSEKVQGFVRGMLDAGGRIDSFRGQIPDEHRRFRDLDYPSRLSDTMTLSTFHGCPSGEVHGITEYLMREPGLHATIKLNPMLLGPGEIGHLLHDVLGYRDIRVPPGIFDRDMKWDEAADIVERLAPTAAGLGLGLGVKFTNTLIVENRTGFLPDSEKEVYLSGPPLHVLAIHLVARFRRRFGDRFPISFSAGIDRVNFPDAVALGLVPVTTCSDLLKPGGYGRLQTYHRELALRMEELGAATIPDFIIRAHGQGRAALDQLGLDSRSREACLRAIEEKGDLRAAAGGGVHDRWVSRAVLLNTEAYLGRLSGDSRYAAARHSRPPRRIGSHLELFDCISCDKCVPVCPNDANFTFEPPGAGIPVVKLLRSGAGWEWRPGEPLRLTEKHQIGTFADFCNECGNCDVFCPEEGGPYKVKPRFFGSEAAWRKRPDLDGFFMERTAAGDRALGRFSGREYGMERRDGRVLYSGSGFSIRFSPSDPRGTVEGTGPAEVDLTYGFIMTAILDGVFNESRVNYVNSL